MFKIIEMDHMEKMHFRRDSMAENGHATTMHRSMEMAISVYADAVRDTPWQYDTIAHMCLPKIHSAEDSRVR